MGSLFALVQHLLFMIIGGAAPADAGMGLTATVYPGLFSVVFDFVLSNPILALGLATMVLGIVFTVGKKAIRMVKG